MNTFISYFRIAALVVCAFVFSFAAQAQTSVITYQGQLNDGAAIANGTFQMQFTLFDAAANGNQIGATITNQNVTVAKGIFTVQLDFSPATPFAAGAPRFLQVAVKKAAETNYTALDPRQPITSAPYAVRTLSADTAATADNLSANCVACVTNNQIAAVDGSKVTGGAAITNLNASNLTAGTVPIARLGTNTPAPNTFLRSDNTFAPIPGGGSFPSIELAVSNTTQQTISTLFATSSFTQLTLSSTNDANAALTGGNTWNGTTFTVGATGAGWYHIQAQFVGVTTGSNGVTTIGYQVVLDRNNTFTNTPTAGTYPLAFSTYNSSTASLFLKNLSTIDKVVYLPSGTFLNFRAQSYSTSTSAYTSTDGSSNLTIVRLK